MEHLNKLSRDEELYQEAFSRKINEVAYNLDKAGLLEEGRIKGKEEGKIEGELEKQKEIALNMLEEGFKLSVVSKITGLSKIEINKLKKTK